MFRSTNTVKLSGIEGIPVLVECSVEAGIGIHVVGILDSQIRESLMHIVSALQACGFRIPGKKVIINLSPVSLIKNGSAYDLPMALALIAASEQDFGLLKDAENWSIAGELGLDGSVRGVPGCVQAVETAITAGLKGVIIPETNAAEVTDLFSREDIPVYGVKNLMEAITVISGQTSVPDVWDADKAVPDSAPAPSAWDRIRSNPGAKRAIEIAAAGGHHILLMGVPGSEKTLLSRALLDILPPMDREEALTAAKIRSAANKGYSASFQDIRRRPFRTPIVTASVASLLGGGTGEDILPGEVSFANGGVLCIEDIAEAPKYFKEALRAPLEDRFVTISHLKSKVTFPSRFQLAATTLPCPCGYFGEGDRCTCTTGLRTAFLSRLFGPVYDRIDIQAFTRKTDLFNGNAEPVPGEDSATVAEKVRKARDIQRERLGKGRLNADLTADEVRRYCTGDEATSEMAEKVINRLGLSARAFYHLLKVARTIADLAGSDMVLPAHVAEAAGYRFLDRRNILETETNTENEG